VHRCLLERKKIEAVKVGRRPDRADDLLQPQAQEDVPRAYPHRSILRKNGNPLVAPGVYVLLLRREVLSEFLQLDYLYTPSRDVAADAKYFTEALGGKLAFAVEGMGARVAMIELTDGPPHVLLTDHLDGDRAIYIYRVEDLRKAVAALKKRGVKDERRLEIPMGPCSSFVLPGGHRIALYEASRPGVLQHFLGRRDF